MAAPGLARPPPRGPAADNQQPTKESKTMTIISPKFIEDANLLDIEAELDRAREALNEARAQLHREAEYVLVTVEYRHGEDGEPVEDRDITYDGDFVKAVIAVKQARARMDDLELREFEARQR
ncbi:hypothetical protein [uncultured Microbacterium sp.]|uniref:hypothetical protein n=1 Tax=uncultured Microbacterium sp. TaxID=191216 RepID=UPI0025D88211|nr:hypothetical protein [uncultured Microbacterium sp.]